MKDLAVKLVSTFLGVGYIPFIAPTWASAVAAVLVWYLPGTPILLTLCLTVAGLWACRPSQTVLKSQDPRAFVMDEVCGMMLALWWIPRETHWYLTAFLLFRLFDWKKPWPISRIQDHPHPWSIMGDDLAAGVAANALLHVLLLFRLLPVS